MDGRSDSLLAALTLGDPAAELALLAGGGVAVEDPDVAWEALYRARPELFAALGDPVHLPTEWGLLACLHAIAAGELERLTPAGEQAAEIQRAARLVRQLTGVELVGIELRALTAGSLADRAFFDQEVSGYCACPEPRLASLVVLRSDWVQLDAVGLGAVVAHEALHASLAAASEPAPGAYRRPLVAAVDELAVSFSGWMAEVALRTGGVPSRAGLAAQAEGLAAGHTGAWLSAALALCPGEAQEICQGLCAIAGRVLADGTDEGAAALLDASAGIERGLAGWVNALL